MARRARFDGGLTQKTGKHVIKDTGEIKTYSYWQASREVAAADLPNGLDRKRVTGNGKTSEEARQRLEENWLAFHRGEARRSKNRLSSKMTVRTLFEEWQRNNEARENFDVMVGKYGGYFRNHVLPALGERRIDALTETELSLFFNQTLATKTKEDGTPLMGGASRRNVYMALSGCLEFAVRSGYLGKNPLKAVKPVRRGRGDGSGLSSMISPL